MCGAAACSSDWQQALDERAIELGYSGATMAVVQDGQEIFSGATGVDRPDAGAPLNASSPMRIASVTKAFTAVVVLQLDQEGALSLDDPITMYVPDFPGDPSTTLSHLARHTSGLGDFRNHPGYWDRSEPTSALDLLQLAYGQTAESPIAGETFEYSSANYLLLGLVIEQASRDSWESQVRTRIVEPLDLSIRFADEDVTLVPGFDLQGVEQTDHPNARSSWSSGSLIGTASDIARFGDALLAGDLLDAAHMDELLDRAPLNTGHTADYGFGIATGDSAFGPYQGNRAFTPGYSASWSYRADLGSTVAVLIPRAPYNGRALERAAWNHLLEQAPP
ncbi:MAG: serine hydrolase domain-containing protein [Myxococcota bacterium]